MLTSISTTAMSVLSRILSASLAEVALMQVLTQLRKDHLVAQQLGRLIVDHQDVDFLVRMSSALVLLGPNSEVPIRAPTGAATCAARKAAVRC